MTVCIAARAYEDAKPVAVLCCDWMTSDGESSSEAEDKLDEWFTPDLVVLSSGNLEHSRELRRACKSHLGEKRLPSTEIKARLHSGLQGFLLGLQNRGVDSSDAELLICGFPQAGRMLVEHIAQNGVSEVLDFRAIGSGYPFAESMLRWRQSQQPIRSLGNLGEALYRVYEAKRFAEAADGVGRKTTLGVLREDQSRIFHFEFQSLQPGQLEFLRLQFERWGPQRLPEEANQFLNLPNVIGDSGSHSRGNP
jgi:hypothetical protein